MLKDLYYYHKGKVTDSILRTFPQNYCKVSTKKEVQNVFGFVRDFKSEPLSHATMPESSKPAKQKVEVSLNEKKSRLLSNTFYPLIP